LKKEKKKLVEVKKINGKDKIEVGR